MQGFKTVSCIVISLFLVACADSINSNNNGNDSEPTGGGGTWLIPRDQVVDGGPGKDGIPSINDPQFSRSNEISFLEDWELVIGVKIGDEIKAYPHVILYYHEIVNDLVGDFPLALTFCPLTGSGIGWNRTVEGEVTEFGVSGLIHKNNLIPYDRNTDSRWSQMLNKSVNGELRGTEISTVQVVEITWGAWKEAYPNSRVLNTDTGFNRDYDRYLYGSDYPENDSNILFEIYNEDNRRDRKDLVHGIQKDSRARAYPIDDFDRSLQVLNEEFVGQPIVVAGSSEIGMAVSFSRTMDDGKTLSFEPVNDSLPVIMEDEEGTQWTLFGEAVSGPREGQQLETTGGYNAYWFAWADFFPFSEIASF